MLFCSCSCNSVSRCASQICAVLAAVTEVIRGQGGKETETEYFAALVSAAFVKFSLRNGQITCGVSKIHRKHKSLHVKMTHVGAFCR